MPFHSSSLSYVKLLSASGSIRPNLTFLRTQICKNHPLQTSFLSQFDIIQSFFSPLPYKQSIETENTLQFSCSSLVHGGNNGKHQQLNNVTKQGIFQEEERKYFPFCFRTISQEVGCLELIQPVYSKKIKILSVCWFTFLFSSVDSKSPSKIQIPTFQLKQYTENHRVSIHFSVRKEQTLHYCYSLSAIIIYTHRQRSDVIQSKKSKFLVTLYAAQAKETVISSDQRTSQICFLAWMKIVQQKRRIFFMTTRKQKNLCQKRDRTYF